MTRQPNSLLFESRSENEPLPFPRSYWVMPGKLLAGYCPEAKSEAVTRQQLRKILECGIRTFVDLMDPGESSFSGGFVHRGYQNLLFSEAKQLSMEVSFHQFPIRDVSVPTIDQMGAILKVIDASLSQHRPVYVHCRGGIGRTGVVVGCFLQHHGFSNSENVLDVIAQQRRNDPKASTVSPETEKQRTFVRNWKRKEQEEPEGLQSSIAEGSVVGGFKVRSLIGKGGMGKTFLASSSRLRAPVAIKVISGDGDEPDWTEAQMAARVQGDHIVPILNAGVAHGERYLVQSYVDGIDLQELITRSLKAELRPPDGFILGLFRQATLGVRSIHSAGVIHRDIKPSNIFLRGDGVVAIGDFGISASDRRRLSGSGTPGFMAPEIQQRCTADMRSDLFALGRTLQALLQLRGNAPAGPIHHGLRVIACKLTEELPRNRYQNTKELLAALSQLAAPRLTVDEVSATELAIGSMRVQVKRGDLVTHQSDVIISAANVWMLMDQGVAKALKDYGGTMIETEARAHGTVAMGDVVWTHAGKLDANYVAHAVSALDGAICLQRCVLRCLLGAEFRKARSVAMPALGTGVAEVPMRLAARRILDAVRLFAEMGADHVQRVTIVVTSDKAQEIWAEVLSDMGGTV